MSAEMKADVCWPVAPLSVVAFGLLTISASAQPMPSFNIQAHCERRVDDTIGAFAKFRREGGSVPDLSDAKGGPNGLLSMCVSSENRSLEELRGAWAGADPEDRAHCGNRTAPSGVIGCINLRRKDEAERIARQGALSRLQGAGEPLPRYDIEDTCRTQARQSHSPSSEFQTCMEKQQQAYDRLKPQWPRLPTPITVRCKGMFRGPGRYTLLESCVNDLLNKAVKDAAMPGTRFRY